MRQTRIATVMGRALLVLICVFSGVVITAIGLEVAFKGLRDWRERTKAPSAHPNADRLEHAYGPFLDMHLNPQYMFFFPRDPVARVAISNATCSLDANGFRGPGPAHAGGRPLAFLLGGSAAFGLLASSDATTITSDLNRLQDKYFFVNAGVPAWNSTQEMDRLAFQILDYHPALIVTYDGVNDFQFIQAVSGTAPDYSVAVPDGFDELTQIVDDAGARSRKQVSVFLAAYLFPELKERIDKVFRRGAPDRPDPPLPDGVIQASVARYLSNLSRMSALATAQGARFVAIFQPVAALHRHLGPSASLEPLDAIEGFHRAVISQRPRDLEFHDLGDVFDQHYASIPVINPDVTDETVFIDQVHLYDPGNEIVARHLAGFIQ